MKENDYFVNDVEAAKILSVSPQTMRNWRCNRKGPAYTKHGARMVRYHVQDLLDYMERGRIDFDKAA
jgi:hypothetical protein